MVLQKTPYFQGRTLSVGVIIRKGRQARRHLKANPIASTRRNPTSTLPECQLEFRERDYRENPGSLILLVRTPT
jgi:hypothetical protein